MNNTHIQHVPAGRNTQQVEITDKNPVVRTQFGEQIVSEKSQIINLKSIYGVSTLRDYTTLTGSGTVTNATGEYKLTTTASGTDSAILDSVERGRYLAGQDALFGMGVRLADTPTGSQVARWGYYDDNDGFGYGKDATGLFIFDRIGGTETKVYQSDWNIDTLDGNGASGLNLDVADGAIYQINFTWYGYGSITFQIVYFDSNDQNKQKTVDVHRIRKTGTVSVEDPNLPIRAEVDNGGSATAFDSLYVGGRQFSTVGKYDPARRVTSERRLSRNSIGTTFVPLVSFRRKSAFESVSVKVSDFDIITDFNAVVQIRINPSLTGASFGTPTDHTASETALEADKSATAATGGTVIFEDLISSSGAGATASGSATVPLIPQDFVNTQEITVMIKTISGTGTASCVFRALEEW